MLGDVSRQTRDTMILVVLFVSMLTSAVVAVGLLISFAASGNPIFIILSALLGVWSFYTGKVHTLFAIEVRQNMATRRTRGHHAKGEANHVR